MKSKKITNPILTLCFLLLCRPHFVLAQKSLTQEINAQALQKTLLQLKIEVREVVFPNSQSLFVFRPDFLQFLTDLNTRTKNMKEPAFLKIELIAGAKDPGFSTFESLTQVGAVIMRKLVSLGWNASQIQLAINSLISPLTSSLKLTLESKSQ